MLGDSHATDAELLAEALAGHAMSARVHEFGCDSVPYDSSWDASGVSVLSRIVSLGRIRQRLHFAPQELASVPRGGMPTIATSRNMPNHVRFRAILSALSKFSANTIPSTSMSTV